MAAHTLNINAESFGLIRSGAKTLEVRLDKDGVESFKAGDHLLVKNRDTGETVDKEIESLATYGTLDDLLATENLALNGNFTTPDTFRQRMRSFQTEAEEAEYGLTAIHLR